MTTKTVKQEAKLEEFTASFLLSEFRKDIREIESKIDSLNTKFETKIDSLNTKFETKIDNKFTWMLSIQFGTLVTVIGVILTIFLKSKGV